MSINPIQWQLPNRSGFQKWISTTFAKTENVSKLNQLLSLFDIYPVPISKITPTEEIVQYFR
jgi:hypothetical protein